MMFSIPALFTLGLSAASIASAAPASHVPRSKPAAFLLAGDSTTASGGGMFYFCAYDMNRNVDVTNPVLTGWGDGFKNYTLKAPAFATNYGHSGATTVSFRAGGDWAKVLADVGKYNKTNSVYVTIQFGHNDQKPAANISLAQYAANLAKFTDEVKALGGVPILVTPLTRRTFSGGSVIQNLANETAATIATAEKTKSRFIDLNKASTDYVNALGQAGADTYNLSPSDRTHLNTLGSIVFGRLVSDLISTKYKDVDEWVKPNKTLSALIAAGKLVTS